MIGFSKIQNGADKNSGVRLKNASYFLFTPEIWKSYIIVYCVTSLLVCLFLRLGQCFQRPQKLVGGHFVPILLSFLKISSAILDPPY